MKTIIERMNQTLKKKININDIIKLFENEEIDGQKLNTLDITQFIELCKPYNISAAKSRKLYNAIKSYIHDHLHSGKYTSYLYMYFLYCL